MCHRALRPSRRDVAVPLDAVRLFVRAGDRVCSWPFTYLSGPGVGLMTVVPPVPKRSPLSSMVNLPRTPLKQVRVWGFFRCSWIAICDRDAVVPLATPPTAEEISPAATCWCVRSLTESVVGHHSLPTPRVGALPAERYLLMRGSSDSRQLWTPRAVVIPLPF